MSEYVNLHKIVLYLEEMNYFMEYKEFRETLKDKVRQQSHTEEILLNTSNILVRDMQLDFGTVCNYRGMGVKNEENRCDHCKLPFNSQWDKQEVWLFKCDHIFHTACIQQSSGQCAVCFNELEAF